MEGERRSSRGYMQGIRSKGSEVGADDERGKDLPLILKFQSEK